MDPLTGRVVRVDPGDVLPAGYIWIPERLQVEAEALLGVERDAHVNFAGDNPLSQFARDQQAAAKKQKARRRRNNRQARQARRQGKR